MTAPDAMATIERTFATGDRPVLVAPVADHRGDSAYSGNDNFRAKTDFGRNGDFSRQGGFRGTDDVNGKRAFDGVGSRVLERAGPFEIRLVSTERELRSAQKLRYTVFYAEGNAIANAVTQRTRRDICPFDAICDHLIVTDTEASPSSGPTRGTVVGTYRLLRREVAEAHHGFYSQGEFDMRDLLARQPTTRFLELGRSCVHAKYRSKRVIELLWRGLWLYAKEHEIDALVGCASLPGTDLDALRLPLSFLHHYAQASEAWQVAAWPHGAAAFTPLAKDDVDIRRGIAALPPLLKAYLRTGARFGRSAVVDHQFGTTDVFTVMPMGDIEERYIAHYGEPSCVSGAPVA